MFYPAPSALVFDAGIQKWVAFKNPEKIIVARRACEVVSALETASMAVRERDCYAVGMVSYEAAPGLNPAIRVRGLEHFPLVWFGLFPEAEMLGSCLPAAEVPNIDPAWNSSISRKQYDEAISRIRALIAAGDTYQANFTFRMQADFRAPPERLFHHMIRKQGNGFAAYLAMGRWTIASASPELFFRLDGNHIVTKPMKGTSRRGLWSEDDFRRGQALGRDGKNRAENLMIVDMARNDLGRIADIGSVHVARLFSTERYPTLWQMTSTIEARTSSDIPEIFQAMFPAASITGAPKIRTTEILNEIETTPRKAYTGSIGFIAPGRKAQFNVAIRTLICDHDAEIMEYGVGGGIVWDSCAAEEFEECRTKTRILDPLEPDFALLESLRWTPIEEFTRLPLHMARLRASADYFQFPFDAGAILDKLKTMARKLPPRSHKVRMVLHRTGEFRIDTLGIAPLPQPYNARLARAPVDPENVFLYHKTTHRKLYEDALATAEGANEVLLWNSRGELTEFCIGNLFLEMEGQLFTPPVESGLLPGTLRRELIDAHKVQERILTRDDLARATRVFMGNSVRGLQPVLLLDEPS